MLFHESIKKVRTHFYKLSGGSEVAYKPILARPDEDYLTRYARLILYHDLEKGIVISITDSADIQAGTVIGIVADEKI